MMQHHEAQDYIKQANGKSGGKDLGIFWCYHERWTEPGASTTMHIYAQYCSFLALRYEKRIFSGHLASKG
jgi:hypothetical protein